MGVEDHDALVAAVAVAEAHGLRSPDAVILRDKLNVLVHLRPAPVVARVAGTIRAARPGTDWQQRELAVAGHLAAQGAPVVAPSDELPPGPYEHDGRVLSFWRYAAPAETSPTHAGAALRECLDALKGFHGSLPVLGTMTEAEALLHRLATEGRLSHDEAMGLQLRFDELFPLLAQLRSPVQPLHGDAHLNNVLGGLWNDWEDTCLGPVAWDAACLIAGSRDPADQQTAYEATRLRLDPGELRLWVEARRLQIDVWRAFLSR